MTTILPCRFYPSSDFAKLSIYSLLVTLLRHRVHLRALLRIGQGSAVGREVLVLGRSTVTVEMDRVDDQVDHEEDPTWLNSVSTGTSRDGDGGQVTKQSLPTPPQRQ